MNHASPPLLYYATDRRREPELDRFDGLLGTDFDGRPVDDVEDVICDALDDPHHGEWVPGLVDVGRAGGLRDRHRVRPGSEAAAPAVADELDVPVKAPTDKAGTDPL